MSSPFRYFRKHTKVFIATAAVLCIFIFVVGDALNSSSGAGGEDRTGATVATWNGGSLNEAQLGSLVAQRMLVNDFLQRVFMLGGGSRDGYNFPSSIPPLFLNTEQMEAVETEVVGTEVLSSLATQAGMTVSEALINHYIEEIGLKNVSQEQIVGILKSLGQHNAQANEAIVFNMLRKMLLAHFYRRTYADASMVVLPQQRWDDWRSVNERISVEAAVLPVEKFLAEVPEPTEAQLLAFYNDYKEADPGRFQNIGGRELPISDPGFAVPRRVTLQYLLGNLNARTEKLMPSVTEEEIKDYYERNKRRDFTKLDLPGDEAIGAPATETPAEPAASKTPARDDAAKTPAEGDAAASASEPPAEAAETPAEPAAPAAEPATEPAAPATEEAEEKESSSSVRKSSPFRLAAFQTAPAETEDTAEPAEDAAAERAEASEPAGESAPTAETPATEPPAAESSATETPAAEEPVGEASEAKTASDADAAAKEDAEEAVEFEPLDKVREDIRKTIAMDKAVQELETVMGEAGAQLQAEYNRYGSLVAAAKEKDQKSPKLPKAPAKLTDLKWLADQYGLTYEKTTPLTLRELYDTAVGKAGDTAQRVTVTQAAYQSLDLYEPMLAEDLEGNWYLVMKTADVPRKVPEFKEVRDQVAGAWRRAEAAKLAEKKAKELAAEVAKAGTPFDQFFFADRGFEVIKPTAFFSWRNYPVGRAGSGTPPGLSDVPELKNVGPEFMEAAFDLDEKEVVGLLNFDRSAAYVIRLDRRQYTGDELKKLFLEEEGAWPGRVDMMNEHYSMFNSAVEREILEERAGLEFDEDWLKRRAERMQERQN